MTDRDYDPDRDVAVIGMAGRFPGADDVAQFWQACVEGARHVSTWDGPRHGEGHVLAGGLLADQDLFDAAAFGVTPAEAELLDPQHRVFLEVCWLALDDAAISDGLVSVYAAAAPSRYRPAPGARDDLSARYQQMIANAPDYLATRVSYLLDLRGEAVNVQTACSSSLVAVHLACQSLRAGNADVALAGGVSIDPDQHMGYVHQEGMIISPDGVCLPFDAGARGAVPGSGGAVVVLQRLGDAVVQGRRVHALIPGTAVNNDGRDKSSFMAPAQRGQAEVIASALSDAGVDAWTIGYLEAHGTGTPLGDAIEFAAASRAFRLFTEREGFCALGSLKANFGHLDRAAGIAALVKAVHVVRDGVVPPLIGFRTPSPEVALEGSPFRVPRVADTVWPFDGPRRAGVSSLGVGGTNAHVVVEEYRAAPGRAAATPPGPFALPLSAHDATALGRFATHLADRPVGTLAGLARTLGAGRRALGSRAVVVARDAEEAAERLREPPSPSVAGVEPLAFLFAGQGAEVRYDPSGLLARYPVFRHEVEAFADAHRMSVPELLAGVRGGTEKYRGLAYQPSLVAVQVALARLAMHLGVAPAAFCGSSIGEYAAAHLAGVFERDGLMTVLGARDRLMRATPEARMMAALCSAERVTELMVPGVELAGDNAGDRVLVSGDPVAIERQIEVLAAHSVDTRVLPGRIAPHGRMMREAAEGLREVLASVRLHPAQLPVVSSLRGDWAEPEQLADPEHWVSHLCRPFLMRQALGALVRSGHRRLVESSPGDALTRIAARTVAPTGQAVTLGCAPGGDAVLAFLEALGALWSRGAPVRWDEANGTAGVAFESLPPYPFSRRRFWDHTPETTPLQGGLPAGRSLAAPVWRPAPKASPNLLPEHVVLRGGHDGVGPALAARLAGLGVRVDLVGPGAPLPESAPVLMDLTLLGAEPEDVTTWLDTGLLRPLEAIRALRPSRFIAVTRGLCPVLPGEQADPRLAAVMGLVRCAPHEWPGLRATLIDLESGDVGALVAELGAADDRDVAYRGGMRYRRHHEPVRPEQPTRLREGGVYLVLGGTGRLGPTVAHAIAHEVRGTVLITGRHPDLARRAAEQALLDGARDRGCTVVERRLDSTDLDALTALLDELIDRHGRVDGIFHLAAHTTVEDFPLLADLDADAALAVVDAKVRTAAHLATALPGRDYGFVVLFSSISTLIGGLRFGPYVSANAYLDALASRMTALENRPWTSVVWDGWTSSGEATEDGLGSLDGAQLLREVLRCEQPVVFAVARDVERRLSGVLADLAAVADAARVATAPGEPSQSLKVVLDTVERVTGHRVTDLAQNLAGLGVESLQMMQIAARLRPVLGPAVSLGAILAARSLSDILDLAEWGRADETADVPVAQPGELSSVEQRLWYLAQLEPDQPSYNVPFGWRLPGSVADATRAVRAVLSRHELLRSTYQSTVDGAVRGQVPAIDVPVDLVELEGDPDEAFRVAARARVDEVFELAQGTGRVLLGHVGGTDVRVLFVYHHISLDAWSVGIIHNDLRRALAGELVAPVAGYRDFVQWEHGVRAAPDYPQHLEFWRKTLDGARPTEPPADQGVVGEPAAVALLRRLPGEVADRLRDVLRAEGVTLYTAGLTGLALALGQWSGERDVVIGTNLANRTRAEFEDVVGMFVDPVVLRLRPTERPDGVASETLGDALAGVRERFAEALAHSEVPYLDVAQRLGRDALFSVIATMFDTEEEGGLPVIDVPLPATSKFPFAIEFLARPDGLQLHVLYAADRYLPSTVDRVVSHIVDFLQTLAVVGPGAPLDGYRARPARTPFARLRDRPTGDAEAEWAR